MKKDTRNTSLTKYPSNLFHFSRVFAMQASGWTHGKSDTADIRRICRCKSYVMIRSRVPDSDQILSIASNEWSIFLMPGIRESPICETITGERGLRVFYLSLLFLRSAAFSFSNRSLPTEKFVSIGIARVHGSD